MVAALRATDTYLGKTPNLHRFAETARDIEYTGMGVTCGFQDFYVTTFGGLLYMDFRDKQDWRGPRGRSLGDGGDTGRVRRPAVVRACQHRAAA